MSADLLTKFFHRLLHFSLGYGHIAKQRAQFHQVLTLSADIAITLQLVEDRVAIHILRYDYRPIDSPEVQLEVSGDLHLLAIKNTPLHSIILLNKK